MSLDFVALGIPAAIPSDLYHDFCLFRKAWQRITLKRSDNATRDRRPLDIRRATGCSYDFTYFFCS